MMNTLIRIETLIEGLKAQLEHGGMTYAEAVVTEEFLWILEQTRACVADDGRKCKGMKSLPTHLRLR